MNHAIAKGFASVGSLAYSSIFPSTSVMINWHNQGGCLSVIKENYLIDAAVRLNPKLKLSPKFQFSAVHAITRLDLSNNELIEVPECIWTMQSLRSLNLAQNKLESLPSTVHKKIGLSALKSFSRNALYNCPLLEEVFLQDNRLEVLPVALFSSLKALTTLDVSNNKLQSLPFEMWTSPSLKELNLSFNLLSELPHSKSDANEMQSDSLNSDVSSSYESDNNLSEATTYSEENDTLAKANSDFFEQERSKVLKKLDLKHVSMWSTSVDIQEKVSAFQYEEDKDKDGPVESKLTTLNLAHNSFSVVPKCLACLAPNLARLNLAYNSISKIGSVSCYPKAIKHLDLSYNMVNSWPGDVISVLGDQVCYQESQNEVQIPTIPENKKYSRINKLMNPKPYSTCVHKSHSRLENLRTLILGNNKLNATFLMTLTVLALFWND